MATHINIEPREHVEKRVSMSAEQGSAYTVATGMVETCKYTGSWEDMLAQAAAVVGVGGGVHGVTCEVERLEGGLGELTVTMTEYREATEEEDDPSGDGEPGTAERPQYTISSECQPVPLLTHPLFSDLGNAELQVLKQLMDGVVLDAVIEVNGTKMKLREALNKLSGAARTAANYLYKGVTQYYEVMTEATARWKGSASTYAAGQVCMPPNAPAVRGGRNWLCMGCGEEKQGDEVWQTARFRLSGQGGWDTTLYPQ